MGESVGHDIALAAPLQSIIADGRSRLHGRLDIAGLDEAPLLLRVVRPHPGKAVGLQLDPNLELIAFDRVHAALRFLHLGQDSEQILHVVVDLVRDHVGLGELAAFASSIAAAETSLEVLKECGVEIDLPIVWTIEWTHGGLGKPHPERVAPENITSVGPSYVLPACAKISFHWTSVLPSTADTNSLI